LRFKFHIKNTSSLDGFATWAIRILNFTCLIFVAPAYGQKYFNGENLPIYSNA